LFCFHNELDDGTDAAKMVEETLKLFFPCVQIINMSSMYLHQHAGFLTTKLMAYCSADSMQKLAITRERGGPMATLPLRYKTYLKSDCVTKDAKEEILA
jgi:hypothetical protein